LARPKKVFYSFYLTKEKKFFILLFKSADHTARRAANNAVSNLRLAEDSQSGGGEKSAQPF
jgi:hypothetical protein